MRFPLRVWFEIRKDSEMRLEPLGFEFRVGNRIFNTGWAWKDWELTWAVARSEKLRACFEEAVRNQNPTSEDLANMQSIAARYRQQYRSEHEPLCTVVIICFNYGRFIREALDSVLSQTLRIEEIIIVDPGSTDAQTIEELKKISAAAEASVVHQAGRPTIGDSRLLGLLCARGRYVAFLDADDRLAATYFEKSVWMMERYALDHVSPNVGVFRDPDTTSQFRHEDGEVWQSLGLPVPRIFETNCCTTSSIFRRSFWEAHGVSYDTRSVMGIEDWDFWCRFAFFGPRYGILHEHLHEYRLHGASATDGIDNIYAAKLDAIRLRWNFAANAKVESVRTKEQPKKIVVLRSASGDALGQPIEILVCRASLDDGTTASHSLHVAKAGGQRARNTALLTTAHAKWSKGSYDELSRQGTAVYMRNMFRTENECGDFIRYFIATHGTKTIVDAGSALLRKITPALQAEFPQLLIVDGAGS